VRCGELEALYDPVAVHFLPGCVVALAALSLLPEPYGLHRNAFPTPPPAQFLIFLVPKPHLSIPEIIRYRTSLHRYSKTIL
jgi:hypothetical protein